jgi:hypothetical protein
LDPITEYKNRQGFANDAEAFGVSVTGGYVYRGKALPWLQGRYLYGDWSRTWNAAEGVILVATRPEAGQGEGWVTEPLVLETHAGAHIGAFVLAFGQDAEGELYVLTSGTPGPDGRGGQIHKLVRM